MPFLLRKLDKRTRWNKQNIKDTFEWLGEHEFPSDYIIKELETENCTLSFWVIDDEKSNLNRVLAALAGNRPHPAEIDFGLVRMDLIQTWGFNIEANPGDTADTEANDWHRDISKLSAKRLVELAVLLLDYMEDDRRRTRTQILDFMVRSIKENHLERSKIKTQSDELEARLNL